MFVIFYGNRSIPDNTPGCGGGHMASKISRENGLEHRIDRVASSSLGKTAKSLFIFLFFSFSFLLSWTCYTEGSVGKVSHHKYHSHMTGSHSVTSHDVT